MCRGIVAAALLALGGWACGKAEGGETANNPANGPSGQQSTGELTDAQLVGVTQAQITASTAMANIGDRRAKNINVRAFVQSLSTQSANATANLANTAAAAGLAPEPTDESTAIGATSQQQIAALSALADADFDEGFVESVDAAQSAAAAQFAASFVPSGTDASMRAFVADFERTLEDQADYAHALIGDFNPSEFFDTHNPGPTLAVSPGGGAAVGSGSSSSGGDNGGASSGGTTSGNGTTSGTGTTNGIGTGTTTGGVGIGSGAGEGLGGSGTATGTGEDPGSAVGTGTSSSPNG